MNTAFDLLSIPEASLSNQMEKEIISLQYIAFPYVEVFRNQRWGDSQPTGADMWFLAKSSQGLVASVWLHRRTISAVTNGFSIGGIANVCSRPDFRGKGAAKACMLEAQNYIVNCAAIDCGLLFVGPKVASFYDKLGWHRVENRFWFTNGKGERNHDDYCIKMVFPAHFGQKPWPKGDIDLNGPEW